MLTKGKALKLTKKDKALRLRKPIMCYPPSLSICTGVKDFLETWTNLKSLFHSVFHSAKFKDTMIHQICVP